MAPADAPSDVLTIRIRPELARRLARQARRRQLTRSELAREILEAGLQDAPADPRAEARRQSLLARERESEVEALQFVVDAADLRGWQ